MNIVKVILIGAGGYLLYDYLTGGNALGFLGGASSVVGQGQTVSQTPGVDTMNEASQATTYQMIASKVQKDAYFQAQGGLMTASQWNYYYNIVRGVKPQLKNNPYASGYRMSLDQYWQLVVQSGLSGMPQGGYAFGAYRMQRWVM